MMAPLTYGRLIVLSMCALAIACEDPGPSASTDAGSLDAVVIASDAPTTTSDAAHDSGRDDGWRVDPALPEPIQEICGAVHDGRLWIAGGLDAAARVVDDVRVYDPATGAWSDGPSLPAPRHHAMMVSDGPDLYVLGGMLTLAFEPLDTAWVLREGSSSWEEIARMPEDRGAGAAGVVAGRIVVAAGNSSRGGLASTTLVYDPSAAAWSIGRPIPTEREHTSAFVHDGELFVVAGRLNSLSTNRTEVDAYDPVADRWRAVAPIPTARGGHGVAVLDGLAYAVGGEQPDRALDSVEVLDLDTETWATGVPVPTPRHGHVLLAAAGRLWVVAGGDRPTFAAVDVLESFAP